MSKSTLHRELPVPDVAVGMRLDRFLSARFTDVSRNTFLKGIKDGHVTLAATGTTLRASYRLRASDVLHITMPGIAPDTPPPTFPDILHEDERLVALQKPAGLLAHPAGTKFAWSIIGLAKERWPDHRIDLVHRLDRDTSGVILLTKDIEANRELKERWLMGEARKTYLALCKGAVPWMREHMRGPIGYAEQEIRVQMAVRPDGLAAHTEVWREGVRSTSHGQSLSLVRCRLHTGRTHQIRVHLAHAGFPLLGDRLYGVPPEVFLDTLAHGALSPDHEALTGAPRQALHAARLTTPHPDGGELTIEAPLPPDMDRWWNDAERLRWQA